MDSSRRFNADPFLLGLLALSLATNVWLGWQVRRARAAEPSPPKLKAGDRLPALEALDSAGQRASVGVAGESRPTVFYVFSPTCSWCQRNREAVAALAQGAGSAYRFVGLCVASHDQCATAGDRPPFATYSQVAARQVAELGLATVPQTIVAAPDGRITRLFRGAYVGGLGNEVESFFAVKLPEVSVAGGPAHAPGPATPAPQG